MTTGRSASAAATKLAKLQPARTKLIETSKIIEARENHFSEPARGPRIVQSGRACVMVFLRSELGSARRLSRGDGSFGLRSFVCFQEGEHPDERGQEERYGEHFEFLAQSRAQIELHRV